MAARSGLVSYGGDSEISDSEDERTPIHSHTTESSVPIIGTNDLGIPSSHPQPVTTPPSLPAMVVEAAPTTLVDYTMHEEEEDERNDSKGDEEMEEDSEGFVPTVETETSDTLDGEEMNSMDVDNDVIPLYLRTTDVLLPPEPTAKCSKSLQNKIVTLLQKRASSGVDLNSSLQSRKDLRNPSILEKLVQFCDLKEFGTNYPEHIYNPNEFTEESMYDKLYLQQQKANNAKKEKAKLNSIEFVTATKKAGSAVAPASGSASEKDKALKRVRRTKWDVGSGGGTDSGGSRGASPTGAKDRPALLGSAPSIPLGLQPRVLQSAVVGAQARAQASQIKQELKKAMNQ